VLDKAEYSAFQSTLNSTIVSYRIVSHPVDLVFIMPLYVTVHVHWYELSR